MRIVTSAQMAAIDADTILSGVPGLELMERAGREMVLAILDLMPEFDPPAAVAVCCGKGNNGGDGLVVARQLDQLGYEVTVMMLTADEDLAPDARTNLDRLPEEVEIVRPAPEDWAREMGRLCAENDLLIDAVFGTGIRPPVSDAYAALFAACDRRLATVVSLDVPSGVSGDDGSVDPVAVRADATVTVGLPKLGLLLPPGRDHVGAIEVVDIGFPDEITESHASDLHYLLMEEIADLLPDRPGDLHKYTAGTALVVAGSHRFGGAALLAGLGALRSGAGLVSLALPQEHAAVALGFVPEALLHPLPTGNAGGLAPVAPDVLTALLDRQCAWAVGPGLGDDPDTDRWVVEALAAVDLPTVVDADALSAFARLDCEPSFASAQTILTPHVGELARLGGVSTEEAAARRLELAGDLARRWNVVVVAKGAPTIVAAPDGFTALNATGNDALAHGGTGDVLTGLLVGLLAQGMEALDAALLGCWLHGRAGELAGVDGSRRSVLAREVADHLGEAMTELTWRLGWGEDA